MAVDIWSASIDKTKWQMFKICTCGGILRHKYRLIANHNRELHILPNRNRFILLDGGKQFKSGPITELKQTIDTL